MMGRQLWIADKCRQWGLDVVEVDGWKTRGSSTFAPRALVAHHTAGPAKGDYPSLRIVRDGRRDLTGPLSQCGLGRSGKVYVVAAGRANHAGGRYDTGWRGVKGNTFRMGVEAESVGTRNDWTAAQREAYPVLCAALLDGMSAHASMLCGHRETASNKIDPAYWDMDLMRSDVATLLAAGPKPKPAPPAEPKDRDMAVLIQPTSGPHADRVWVNTGQIVTHLRDWDEAADLEWNGVLGSRDVVAVSPIAFDRLIIVKRAAA